MVDKVKPIGYESTAGGGGDNPAVPSEIDPAEDYISCKGISFQGNDGVLIHDSPSTGKLIFTDLDGSVALQDINEWKTRASNADTTRGYIKDKVKGKSGEVTATIKNAGGNEYVEIALVTPSSNSSVIEQSFPEVSANSTTWVRAGELFIFPGTDNIVNPSAAKMIAWVDSGATGAARLYNLTSASVIATSASFSSTSETIQNLGTLTGLPTGAAMFEWQIQRVTGSGPDKTRAVSGVLY